MHSQSCKNRQKMASKSKYSLLLVMILHPSSFYLWHWQSFDETFYWVYQSIKHGIYHCFLAGPSEQDLDGEDERSEGNPWRAVCSALVFSCTILWLFLIHILCVEGLIYRLILSMSFLCLWDSQIFLRVVAMQIIASTHLSDLIFQLQRIDIANWRAC
mgnify:FL=1